MDRRKIVLEHPIKTTGEFMVSIHLHKEVRASIKVVVEKELEAERQPGTAPGAASGEPPLHKRGCLVHR